MADETAPLLERYKLAVAEYRAEVTLGADRVRLFVTLNPAVVALSSHTHRTLATAALVLAAAASVLGILVVGRSHGRYRQTRNVLLTLATALGCAGDWQTTGGMREARAEPRFEGLKVSTAVQLLLGAYVVFDLVAAAWLWAS